MDVTKYQKEKSQGPIVDIIYRVGERYLSFRVQRTCSSCGTDVVDLWKPFFSGVVDGSPGTICLKCAKQFGATPVMWFHAAYDRNNLEVMAANFERLPSDVQCALIAEVRFQRAIDQGVLE